MKDKKPHIYNKDKAKDKRPAGGKSPISRIVLALSFITGHKPLLVIPALGLIGSIALATAQDDKTRTANKPVPKAQPKLVVEDEAIPDSLLTEYRTAGGPRRGNGGGVAPPPKKEPPQLSPRARARKAKW